MPKAAPLAATSRLTIQQTNMTTNRQRLFLFIAVGVLAVGFLIVSPPARSSDFPVHDVDYMTELENEVMREQNLARTDPQLYATFVEEWYQYYRGRRRTLPNQLPVLTTEGKPALKEAIEYLQNIKPLPPLRPAEGLSLAARDHVRDTGGMGWLGHLGSDDSEPGDRVSRYGTWIRRVGENITYGGDTAREFVIRLIVDDGIPDRGHRENLFNPAFGVAGVSFGWHREYRTMCVITYAGDFDPDP